jgi:hypothetical protein
MRKVMIISILKSLQEEIHECGKDKGWWDDHARLKDLLRLHGRDYGLDENLADILFKTARSMLAVTEIAEGVEGLRKGDPPDESLTRFSSQTVEIADDIIRQLDLAARFNLPVIEAMLEKIEYNKTRERLHGGKTI